VISKTFDSGNDHTTGSGNSIKLDYNIDQYGGIYIIFTDTNAVNLLLHPYINGEEYRKFSFWIKSLVSTSDWIIDIKDKDGNKARFLAGNIGTSWQRKEYDLVDIGNQFPAVKITNVNTLVLLNTNSGSMGTIWIDDIVVDDLEFLDISESKENLIKFSHLKIDRNNQSIRLSITPKLNSKIKIEILNKKGIKVTEIVTGDFYYTGGTEYTFEWYGKDINDASLRNGIYFMKIKIDNQQKSAKVIRPIGIFR
ncbi:MAG: hypothetical protein JW827_08525, partial [Spirochaetes bacterium]|nr:hypothetical protein [Spirochaetota bacterium]